MACHDAPMPPRIVLTTLPQSTLMMTPACLRQQQAAGLRRPQRNWRRTGPRKSGWCISYGALPGFRGLEVPTVERDLGIWIPPIQNPKSSALSQLNFGIDRLEFTAGIVDFHLPIDAALSFVDII